MDVSQCQLLEEKAGEGKAAKAARHLFGPPAAPVQGKNLGSDQPGERLVHAATLCSSPMGKAAGQLHPRDRHSEYSRAKWH